MSNITTLAANVNPFDGITPDFAIFGAEFTELWQKVLAGAWGLALVVCAIFLIVAFSRISTASAQQNDGALATAKSQAAWSGIGLALCLAVAVIFGAIAYFVL